MAYTVVGRSQKRLIIARGAVHHLVEPSIAVQIVQVIVLERRVQVSMGRQAEPSRILRGWAASKGVESCIGHG
jgi:hypothetical protein